LRKKSSMTVSMRHVSAWSLPSAIFSTLAALSIEK